MNEFEDTPRTYAPFTELAKKDRELRQAGESGMQEKWEDGTWHNMADNPALDPEVLAVQAQLQAEAAAAAAEWKREVDEWSEAQQKGNEDA